MKILSVICVFISFQAFGLDLTLHLNKGAYDLFGQSISCAAFNDSPELESKNVIIDLAAGEVLNLTVINHDTLDHTFTIPGVLEADNIIGPEGVLQVEVVFPQEGTYAYFSDRSYGQKIGAGGQIFVGYDQEEAFYWNLFDLNKGLTFDFADTSVDQFPLDYQPELFLINGAFYPNTIEDSNTLIAVDLFQSVLISIVNHGHMDHVLHFHGFHVEIVDANVAAERVGWIKDTVPIKKGEAMTVRLVADQAGVYPVHDHNLIAVTNTGFYPGGMLTQIQVAE